MRNVGRQMQPNNRHAKWRFIKGLKLLMSSMSRRGERNTDFPELKRESMGSVWAKMLRGLKARMKFESFMNS